MPGAAEFGQVEARISQLTDAELVDMVEEHPSDFEPWALDVGRAELARRNLPPTDVVRLRAENAADAAETSRPDWGLTVVAHFAMYVLLPLALVAFPFYFVLARRVARNGNLKTAKLLRFAASVAILFYCAMGLTLLVAHFWP